MRKISYLLAGVAFVTGLAQPACAETLEDVLASTYATNPTLLARRARLRSADEGVPQALSSWRPTVVVSGSMGRGVYATNQFDQKPGAASNAARGEPTRNPKTATVTVSQALYRGGRTVAATSQAENTVLAERALLNATEEAVLLNAATAYLNVVRDESVLKLSINNEQVLRRQLEAAQERFKVGEITRTDVSQAEARLAGATADRVSSEGTLQSSRANYLNNVGRPPEGLEQPAASVPVPATFDEVMATALAENPNIVAADYTYKAAQDGIDLVFGELLPTVSVSADYSRQLETQVSSYPSNIAALTNKEILLNVSVPLYEGGSTYSRVRAQKHTTGQRRIEADQARRDATETATRGWENLQAARAQVRSFQSQIRASELALAGVEEEAKVGSRTVLDVLNAEQELFNARVNLARAQHDEMVAALQVKSSVGQLTAQGLALQTDVYDATKHYDDVKWKWIGTGIGGANSQ
jgi:outer membrane protein